MKIIEGEERAEDDKVLDKFERSYDAETTKNNHIFEPGKEIDETEKDANGEQDEMKCDEEFKDI